MSDSVIDLALALAMLAVWGLGFIHGYAVCSRNQQPEWNPEEHRYERLDD